MPTVLLRNAFRSIGSIDKTSGFNWSPDACFIISISNCKKNKNKKVNSKFVAFDFQKFIEILA